MAGGGFFVGLSLRDDVPQTQGRLSAHSDSGYLCTGDGVSAGRWVGQRYSIRTPSHLRSLSLSLGERLPSRSVRMQFDAFGVAAFPWYVSVGGRAVIQFFSLIFFPSFGFDMIIG